MGGLKFAFELDSSSPGAEITQKILVDKIELDPHIDDSHFDKPQVPSTAEPPAPPPFPRFRKSTLGAFAAIAFGLVILALHVDGGSFTPVALIAILGGVVSLVYNMRQGPPTDSGWDDGAVV